MHLQRIDRSETRCITVATLKQNERVSHQSEDNLMGLWIEAAEDLIERRTNRSIMEQTLRLTAHGITPTISLPRTAVSGADATIVSATTTIGGTVTSYGTDGLLYEPVDTHAIYRFPDIRRLGAGRVVVEYRVGATDPTAVPAAIRQAALLLASTWYRSREAINTDMRMRTAEAPLPFGAEALIGAYRLPSLNVEFTDEAWGIK